MKLEAKKTLTFGDFVARVFNACSHRKAKALVRSAVNAHVVVFQGRHRFIVS